MNKDNLKRRMPSKLNSLRFCSFFLTIVCGLLCFSCIVVAAVLSALYSQYIADNTYDIYDTKGFCKVISAKTFNTTCPYNCNCSYFLGRPRACDTCYYKCYGGIWDIHINNINLFENNITKSDGWSSIIYTSKDDSQININNTLNSHSINSIYNCWYDSSDYYNVSWDKSEESSNAYLISMIIMWCIFGISFSCFILQFIISIVVKQN